MSNLTDFVYRATVIQFAPTDGPDYLWANQWEFTAQPGFLNDNQRVSDVANAFRLFHQALLLPSYGVDRVVISTYGPDLPFPPGFAVFPYRSRGTNDAGGRPLPLEVVAFARKRVNRGRHGKIFLRGVLTSNAIRAEEFITDAGVDIASGIRQQGNILLATLQTLDVTPVLAVGPISALQTRPVVQIEPVNARTLQYRTRRKTRLQQNAMDNLREVLGDNAIDPSEVATVIQAIERLFPTLRNPPQLPG